MTLAALITAVWLGILTAISPCPLATNIAAISFISRRIDSKKYVLLSGVLYTFGRTLAYVILGIIITAGMMASSTISLFLQKYLNEALGPILILLGMVLLGWIGSRVSLSLAGNRVQEKAAEGGIWWALLIGILFAVSFCPVSAALFFGGLIPLSIKHSSSLLLPVVYGIGTALPVIIFAFIIAFAAAYVGHTFHKLTAIELWVRRITGTIFILAGIYYCLTYIYGCNLLG
jgi:cytochrome c biogenesis protein CcdA